MQVLSKQAQREICLKGRRALSSEQRESFSKLICDKVMSLDEFRNAKCILSYRSSFDEVCPDYLSDSGKQFCYPVSYEDGIMEARLPDAIDGWQEGRFGILSPDIEHSVLVRPEDIDLVIVPCVGFDESRRRLGHGKGYYDRYLPKCKNANLLAIAFEAQKLDEVATDQYDVPMQFVVTEKQIY